MLPRNFFSCCKKLRAALADNGVIPALSSDSKAKLDCPTTSVITSSK